MYSNGTVCGERMLARHLQGASWQSTTVAEHEHDFGIAVAFEAESIACG